MVFYFTKDQIVELLFGGILLKGNILEIENCSSLRIKDTEISEIFVWSDKVKIKT